MFAKVFTQILDSSLAEDYQTRLVFEDLLKLCDPSGVVDMTHESIARRTNVPLEIVKRGIAELEKCDPRSRNPNHEGRRIVRLDDHRDWGWLIVNYSQYRQIASEEQRRAKTAERVKRWKAKRKGNAEVTPGNAGNAMEMEMEMEEYVGRDDSPQQRRAVARPASKLTDSQWLDSLKSDPAYGGIDVHREHAKMLQWCEVNGKKPTRRRLINWLNRTDRPMTAKCGPPRNCI